MKKRATKIQSHDEFRTECQQLFANLERQYLKGVLEEANGNQRQAARLAGKDPRNFHKLLVRYGLLAHGPGLPKAGNST